jgi:hypothetical protein
VFTREDIEKAVDGAKKVACGGSQPIDYNAGTRRHLKQFGLSYSFIIFSMIRQ